MFDIGFWELFFLFLLALFVLGPERLPVVASYLGKQFGKVQRYFSNVRNQIDDEVDSTDCLLYTSPSPRDYTRSRMPSSA